MDTTTHVLLSSFHCGHCKQGRMQPLMCCTATFIGQASACKGRKMETYNQAGTAPTLTHAGRADVLRHISTITPSLMNKQRPCHTEQTTSLPHTIHCITHSLTHSSRWHSMAYNHSVPQSDQYSTHLDKSQPTNRYNASCQWYTVTWHTLEIQHPLQ